MKLKIVVQYEENETQFSYEIPHLSQTNIIKALYSLNFALFRHLDSDYKRFGFNFKNVGVKYEQDTISQDNYPSELLLDLKELEAKYPKFGLLAYDKDMTFEDFVRKRR